MKCHQFKRSSSIETAKRQRVMEVLFRGTWNESKCFSWPAMGSMRLSFPSSFPVSQSTFTLTSTFTFHRDRRGQPLCWGQESCSSYESSGEDETNFVTVLSSEFLEQSCETAGCSILHVFELRANHHGGPWAQDPKSQGLVLGQFSRTKATALTQSVPQAKLQLQHRNASKYQTPFLAFPK